MSILSAWRARCDRNAELRDERNDLIRAVNDAYLGLVNGDAEKATRFLDEAEKHLYALRVAVKALRPPR